MPKFFVADPVSRIRFFFYFDTGSEIRDGKIRIWDCEHTGSATLMEKQDSFFSIVLAQVWCRARRP
jgi:hypothetical protein